jgi:Transposase DDE domain group 1
VNDSKRRRQFLVSTDGPSMVSHAGTAALVELSEGLGIMAALREPLAPLRQRVPRHRPEAVVRDLAVSLADGGTCLSDLAALREEPELFGEVASDPTAYRVVRDLGEMGLGAIREARAAARSKAWEVCEPPEQVILDFDATLVTTRTHKEEAAPTYKRSFGFHPLLCYLAERREALAGILRPGNAGSNTASDHIEVLDLALAQIPETIRRDRPMLARADSAGASHKFVKALRERGVQFSIGFSLSPTVQRAIMSTPKQDWVPALRADESERPGAQVCELSDRVDDIIEWPEGSRIICRRERPHPGAQLSFTDLEGWRYQVFLTDQGGDDLAQLELCHRRRSWCENCIREGKDTGLKKLPFHAFALNQVWLELVLLAQDLLAHFRNLCLAQHAQQWEPKTLRFRLLHVAARLSRSGRRLHLRLSKGWRWRRLLQGAFLRVQAIAVT